jgi:L-threonylcarbamoyladenylate synthase
MKTEVLVVSPDAPDRGPLARAAEVLLRGGLVAFPTETVYGLGALADDAACVARIFEAKGRPAYNPLIVHVLDEGSARPLCAAWTDTATRAARAFWPGPLTLVLPRDARRVPDVVTAGGPTVAVRAPAHPVARALLEATGRPLAAPSANRFQHLSPVTAAHVLKSLDGRVDLVLDGGRCPYGIESTVLDLTRETPVVLRPGALALERLRDVLGDVRVREQSVGEGEVLPSPGMLRKHYAPRARLVLARSDALEDAVRAVRDELGASARVGVLRVGRGEVRARGELVRVLPGDPSAYGAELFSALHDLDDAGCDAVIVEAVPEETAWEAVRDRLGRAAAN